MVDFLIVAIDFFDVLHQFQQAHNYNGARLSICSNYFADSYRCYKHEQLRYSSIRAMIKNSFLDQFCIILPILSKVY